MPDDLKVYASCVVAPCRPVLLFLKENGVEYSYVEINVLQNEHLTPEFLEKNPKHTLPVIEHNGIYISEAPAILNHLHDACKIPRLSKEVQSQVDQLVSWSCEQLHWNIGFSYVYPQIYSEFALEDSVSNNKLIETGIKKICEDLDTLEKSYLHSNKSWLLGVRTTADFTVASIVVVLELVNFDFKMWPNVINWLERVRSLPGWGEVHKFHDDVVRQIREQNGSSDYF